MSAQQRIVRASVGAFMAMTCALGLGGFAATSASAAPATPSIHHGCPLGHRGHYPPGQCRIFFNRGVYHPGHQVRFVSGKIFRTHESVTEHLICHNGRYHKSYGTKKAGRGGRVRDHIRLSKHVGAGGCRLVLTGTRSGVRVHGHLKVRN
jgi:hypothetical protein